MDVIELRKTLNRLIGVTEALQVLDNEFNDGPNLGAQFALHETLRRELDALYDSLDEAEYDQWQKEKLLQQPVGEA